MHIYILHTLCTPHQCIRTCKDGLCYTWWHTLTRYLPTRGPCRQIPCLYVPLGVTKPIFTSPNDMFNTYLMCRNNITYILYYLCLLFFVFCLFFEVFIYRKHVFVLLIIVMIMACFWDDCGMFFIRLLNVFCMFKDVFGDILQYFWVIFEFFWETAFRDYLAYLIHCLLWSSLQVRWKQRLRFQICSKMSEQSEKYRNYIKKHAKLFLTLSFDIKNESGTSKDSCMQSFSFVAHHFEG